MRYSVALCTYNGEQFIEQQLCSILSQTVHVHEIVVSDDGSTDQTLAIVERIAEAHPEVDFRIKRNTSTLGVSLNFDQAILSCTGDIVFLSDQDDIWCHDKVETIAAWFKNHPGKDVIFTDADLVNTNGETVFELTLFNIIGFNNIAQQLFDDGLEHVVFTHNYATGATMALRKSTYRTIASYTNNYYLHDGLIALFALTNHRLGYINRPLIHYRQHTGQQVGLSYQLSHQVAPDIYFQTYPFQSDLSFPLMKQYPLSSEHLDTITFMEERKLQLEKPWGLILYLWWIATARYHRFFGRYAHRFYKYDLSYWITLRKQRRK